MSYEHQVKECSICSEDEEHEGIEQSCQICKKKSPDLMTMNPLVGGWYHPWQRTDHRGIFFGIKCNECIEKYPAKEYIEEDEQAIPYEELWDL